MKPFLLIALTSVFAFAQSCKKDDEPIPPVLDDVIVEKETVLPPKPSATDYFPLKKGNYWIYEVVTVDSNDMVTKDHGTDSIVVTGDTVINTLAYFKLEGSEHRKNRNNTYLELVRDSAGYLINSNGDRHFTMTNFNDTISRRDHTIGTPTEILATERAYMKRISGSIETKVGAFNEVISRENLVHVGPTIKSSYSRYYPRTTHRYYAKGVGRIFESYFYLSQPDHVEVRLVEYCFAP